MQWELVAEEKYITVEVLRDSKSFKVEDKVTMKISRTTNGTNDYYAVNNKVRVTFSGLIEDSNPPQINAGLFVRNLVQSYIDKSIISILIVNIIGGRNIK